jgi:hypothetical protein
MEAQLPNIQDGNAAPAHPARSVPGPLHVEANEETDIDVEIMEEGEEGKSAGPVPGRVKGLSNLKPTT